MKKINKWLAKLQHQVQRPYYFVLLAFITLVDAFVFFLPTDGLLVTSVFAHPKAWFRNALGTTVGSVLGSLIFAALIHAFGPTVLHSLLPGVETSAAWALATELMADYGVYAVLLIALTPLPQPPIVAMAALGNMSLWTMGAMLLVGRFIKYLLLSRIAARSPELVGRLFGMKKEVEAAKSLSDS